MRTVKRSMNKMLGLIIVLIVGVFVGIEWAQSGIERVNGPWDSVTQTVDQSYIDDRMTQPSLPASATETSVQNLSNSNSQPEVIWIDIDQKPVRYVRGDQTETEQSLSESEMIIQEEPLALSEPPANAAPVNQLADKAAGMLQQLSEAGMKAVVGVFSGLF